MTADETRCDCADRLRAEARATEPTRDTPLVDIPARAHRATWFRLAATFLEGGSYSKRPAERNEEQP